MKYFNYEDFTELSGQKIGLPEDGGDLDLAPVGQVRPNRRLPESRDSSLHRSDPVIIACIRDYEQNNLEDEGELVSERLRQTVTAVPRLVWDASELSLELSVGESRQYVVRSMVEFCGAQHRGEPLVFGKQFTLSGAAECFDVDSRKLVRFIMERYEAARELDGLGSGYPYNAATDKLFTKGKRGLYLTPSSMDRFCAMYLNQSVAVCRKERLVFTTHGRNRIREGMTRNEKVQHDGFERRLYIKEGVPKLALHLERSGEGVVLEAECLPLTLKGQEYLYLYFADNSECLWRCDRPYKKDMERFLTALWQGMGRLFIAERDLVRFCAGMVPQLEPYVELSGDLDCLTAYTPQEMKAVLFLDSPSRNVIAAAARADYGGVQVELYGDQDGPEGVLRNYAAEERLRLRLSHWFSEMDPRTGILYLRGDDDKLYDFLQEGQHELARDAQVFVTDRYRRLIFPQKTKLAARVSIDSQLLKVTFDFEGFPADELLDALSSYRARRRYHRLADGAFAAFEEQELLDALHFAEGMQLGKEELARGAAEIPRYRAMYLDRIMKEAETIRFDRDSHYRQLIREIHGIEDSELSPPAHLESVLRDYQRTGFCWLASMARLGFGGVLADDMGLGKTLEMISVLAYAAAQGQPEPGTVLALVVCPASLVLNWEQELLRFAPELIACTVFGTAGERKKCIGRLRSASAGGTGAEDGGRLVAITSYDLLKRDLPLYDGISFLYHIVDEAQYIKNYSTQNARAVKGIGSAHRFALTGTPVENRLSELWSIFDFLMPGFLGDYGAFKEEYELPILRDRDEEKTERLRGQIMPFVLRRLKRKVLPELPEKVESVVYVSMEKEQRKIYLSNLAKVKLEIGKEIREGGFESHKIQILAMLTRLRQICCHPALCYENYDKESGKLETCIELLAEALDGGHRVLLFSQFTSMLDILARRLDAEHIGYYLLTGQTDKMRRQELVQRFNEGGAPVFLISLKAGGTGLNLTGADMVIHYDPWWNRAAENQATDRAHRIGQKSSVQVYKLVAQNTIEEKILKLQQSKGELADSIIEENSALLSMLDERRLEALFAE